jgi:hypothetical protein
MFTYIKKIEFWIIFYFVIRLYGITDPPLEIGHHWRQVTGLMVARNFLEVNPIIFFPRVDETNGGTGIIGMEFPIMNYLHYLLSLIFGYQHWYGRLINLTISSLGIYYFYLLLRKCLNQEVAWFSTLCLLASTWFVFSRKFMPDTFCMATMFIGLYYGYLFLEKKWILYWMIFFLITTLACLSKIPAVIGFSFIPFFWWKIKPHLKIMFLQSFSVFFTLCLVYLWYFVWNPYLSKTYGNWYNTGKNFQEGWTELTNNLPKVLENFYFHSFNSYVIFGICFLGLVTLIRNKRKDFWLITSIYIFVFLLYAIKSGHFFFHHNYYMIPFIPIMSIWTGYFITQNSLKPLKIFILTIGIIESFANQQHDFFIKPNEYAKMELETIFDKFSKNSDLIAVNGNGNPQLIYLCHRKGWNVHDEQLLNKKFIQEIKSKGCKWILLNKNEKIQSLEGYPLFFENAFFVIYQI